MTQWKEDEFEVSEEIIKEEKELGEKGKVPTEERHTAHGVTYKRKEDPTITLLKDTTDIKAKLMNLHKRLKGLEAKSPQDFKAQLDVLAKEVIRNKDEIKLIKQKLEDIVKPKSVTDKPEILEKK